MFILLLCACGQERSPDPVRAAVWGGEVFFKVHCLALEASKHAGTSNEAIVPFEVENCGASDLGNYGFSAPPSPLTLVAECENRLIHLTSKDTHLNQVRALEHDGSFSITANYRLAVAAVARDGAPCFSDFTVEVTGKADCVSEIEVRTKWTENRALWQMGCPSTLPCQFTTRDTHLSCD